MQAVGICIPNWERFLSYRLQRATKEENQPNAVEGALAPPNVAGCRGEGFYRIVCNVQQKRKISLML